MSHVSLQLSTVLVYGRGEGVYAEGKAEWPLMSKKLSSSLVIVMPPEERRAAERQRLS